MTKFLPIDSQEQLDNFVGQLTALKNTLKIPTLTLNQLIILLFIYKHSPIRSDELKKIYKLPNATLSRTLSVLIDSGIATKEVAAYDRRLIKINITSKGHGILGELFIGNNGLVKF